MTAQRRLALVTERTKLQPGNVMRSQDCTAELIKNIIQALMASVPARREMTAAEVLLRSESASRMLYGMEL